MTVIHARGLLAGGIDSALAGIRKAQERFGAAALDVARQGASLSTGFSQTPPNPGPPGGAVPGSLTEQMVAQHRASLPAAADLPEAMLSLTSAKHEVAANVKTLQAFDAMLEELSRLGANKPAPR